MGVLRVAFTERDGSLQMTQTSDYSPFGVAFNEKVFGVNQQNYQFTWKESQKDFGLRRISFFARDYNPSIGRWCGKDSLADQRSWVSPYNYVQNNPTNRIDPEGLTDFTVNRKTGDITQVGEENDEPDRILKTNRKGEVKYRKNGEAKVAIDDISKGILEDGLNLKENDVTFEVNVNGQPVLEDFNRFISKFSDYVGKEIAGIRLGESDNNKVLKVKSSYCKQLH